MSSIADLLDSNGEFGRDPSLSSICPLVQGVVTDNGDKKFAGMVKVEFTAWKTGKNVCEWIPLLRPYAGKEYGAYCVPEVGDIVLVGFMGTGMKRPFVMGSFFPAEAKMVTESFVEKNTNRRWKTKAGIDVTLSDEQNKQAVTVATPKGLTVKLEDEKELITVSDKDGGNSLALDCKGGQITIEAKSKITIKAGKCEITLDGQGGAISLQCDRLDMKANQQATVTGNQMMTVTGNVLKAEGKQTAQFKAGTMAELSASMVKIN